MSQISPAKFQVFLKNRELEETIKLLRQFESWPDQDKKSWVKANGKLMHQLFDDFVDRASSAMDGLELDLEGLDISRQFLFSLHGAIDTMENMIRNYEQSKPKSPLAS